MNLPKLKYVLTDPDEYISNAQLKALALELLKLVPMEGIEGSGLDSEAIMEVVLRAAVGTTSINGVTENTEDTPDRKTVMDWLHTLEKGPMLDAVNDILALVAMTVLDRDRSRTICLDFMDNPFHGFPDDEDEYRRMQARDGTTKCHRYCTAFVIAQGKPLTLAVEPVDGDDSKADAGERVRRLIDIVEDCANLRIRRVFADREFHAADVVTALEERDLFYVIPARRDERVKRFIARMGEDVEGDKQVTVKPKHGFYGPVKNGPVNTRAETTLVGLPEDEDSNQTQVFLTNLVVHGEIRLDRRSTRRQIKRYTRRAGIETSYSEIKEFAPWTTSREYAVRLFHFGFAMLLYDMWLLVDLLVQRSLGIIESRTKPRVIAPRFRGFLRRRLVTLI